MSLVYRDMKLISCLLLSLGVLSFSQLSLPSLAEKEPSGHDLEAIGELEQKCKKDNERLNREVEGGYTRFFKTRDDWAVCFANQGNRIFVHTSDPFSSFELPRGKTIDQCLTQMRRRKTNTCLY